MSSQKLAFTFLIAASIIGLGIIFVRRFTEASCPQNDQHICSFIKKNSNIGEVEAIGNYVHATEDVELHIDWSKKGEMSTVQIRKSEESILDAIFATRYMYLKDEADGKWWREEKSRVENTIAELPFYPPRFFADFAALITDERTTFTAVSDNAKCGDEVCHRYQVVHPDQEEVEQLFVFFSRDDYKLRSAMIVEEEARGNLTITYEPVTIKEPEDIKIVSAGKNIFLEYSVQKDQEEEKNFEYVEQFQQERKEAEGATDIEYIEDTPTPTPSL